MEDLMTLFLAKLLGLYFLLVGLFLLTKGPIVKRAVAELKGNYLITFLTGSCRLLFGLILVLSHTTWTANWTLLIPIIGYLLILSGIIRLFFPVLFLKFVDKMSLSTMIYAGIIMLIIGFLLIYQAFIVGTV